ncbi:CRTAC1 family protein [Lyngbya confervoides]|uniref:CRTAC1 family protein n=1 Tax=Lyngbya confervoides BDU141951 TaxID=1574623 RepID=A0ABD4SZI0_9CYAN|nr:CRTAC1 family protein [Lyngbya confervoides]MCM1981520.1 CRTAC1 family protein [Lyngbya confervoides BDU141951]
MAGLSSHPWFKRLVFLAIALVAALLCIVFQPNNWELRLVAGEASPFTRQPLINQVFRLFDMGVTDINGDGNLDLYTSNHSNEQYILLGQGAGRFSGNQVSAMGLDQDPEFPGLEYALRADSEPVQPGLYLYWKDRRLIIETYRLPNPDQVVGTMTVSAPLNIQQQRGFQIEVQTRSVGQSQSATQLTFNATQPNGKLTMLPGNVALPFLFQLGDSVPLNQVYVGHQRISPQGPRFDLFMRDRHGMAWADVNGDGKLDVFMVRGALKGRIDKLPRVFTDELFVQASNADTASELPRFVDRLDPREFPKGNCPALQTAWTESNGDNRLDLFTLCYKPTPPLQTYPPQLHLGLPEGRYQGADLTSLGLDLSADGAFVWFDVDADGDADLLRSTSQDFWLFKKQDQSFQKISLGKNPGTVAKTFDGSHTLSVADFDQDGDLDVLSASPQGNALLRNHQGTLTLESPQQLGLPRTSLLAHWVDYDNDGRMDVYTLPNGLYRQTSQGRFTATQLLKNQSSRGILEARATWFDADNDGDRDLLTALNFRAPLYRKLLGKGPGLDLQPEGWVIDLYLNPAQQHWLELDLQGLPANPQAIGAQVEIRTAQGTQRHWVGEAEGSHYSQGHYRIYAGLGQQRDPVSLSVRWPNGTEETFPSQAVDQRIVLTQKA